MSISRNNQKRIISIINYNSDIAQFINFFSLVYYFLMRLHLKLQNDLNQRNRYYIHRRKILLGTKITFISFRCQLSLQLVEDINLNTQPREMSHYHSQLLIIITEYKIFCIFSWKMLDRRTWNDLRKKKVFEFNIAGFLLLSTCQQLTIKTLENFIYRLREFEFYFIIYNKNDGIQDRSRRLYGYNIVLMFLYKQASRESCTFSLSRLLVMSSSLCPHYCRNLAHIFVQNKSHAKERQYAESKEHCSCTARLFQTSVFSSRSWHQTIG